MPPFSFRPGFSPLLPNTLAKHFGGVQPIVLKGDSAEARQLAAPVAKHPNRTFTFLPPLDVDADPEAKYRELDWQRMARRRFGELEHELGSGAAASGLGGTKTSADDAAVKLAASNTGGTTEVGTGKKTYPRTVQFTRMFYQANPLELELGVDQNFDRYDFVSMDDDLGIIILYKRNAQDAGSHHLVFYRPSDCAVFPPSSYSITKISYRGGKLGLNDSGQLLLSHDSIDEIAFDPQQSQEPMQLDINLKTEIQLRTYDARVWREAAESVVLPNDIYTGTVAVRMFHNDGETRQKIILSPDLSLRFDITNAPRGSYVFSNPVVYSKSAGDTKTDFIKQSVSGTIGGKIRRATYVSFVTKNRRVIMVTTGRYHWVFVRELDLNAMDTAAEEQRLEEACQRDLEKLTTATKEVKKLFAHQTITTIDRLNINTKHTNKKQVITNSPLELSINFNSINWDKFCSMANTPEGAEVFFYFGKNGSPCRYKASLDRKGEKITLTPKDHTDILPRMILTVARGMGSSLREINNRPLTLIEQLVFGPDIDFVIRPPQNNQKASVEIIVKGDHTGQFRNWANTRPDVNTVDRKVVPGDTSHDFVMETTVVDPQALLSGETHPLTLDNDELVALYNAYRAQGASLVLPEVAAPSDNTYPRTVKLKRMPYVPNHFEVAKTYVPNHLEVALGGTELQQGDPVQRYDFVSMDEDIGIVIDYNRNESVSVLTLYRPSSCKGKIPPDSTTLNEVYFDAHKFDVTNGPINLSSQSEIVDTFIFNPDDGTNELTIDLKKPTLDAKPHQSNKWLPRIRSIQLPGDIYTGVSVSHSFANHGQETQILPLNDQERIIFDANKDADGYWRVTYAKLQIYDSTNHSWEDSSQEIRIGTLLVPRDNHDEDSYAWISFTTSNCRVDVLSNNYLHRLLVRELDLVAMAREMRKIGQREFIRLMTNRFHGVTKSMRAPPIASIDRLQINRNNTNSKQIITTAPIEIGINFNAINWKAFCNNAQGKEGAEIFLYFGQNGSACRYKASMDPQGKRITLTPVHDAKILPALVLTLGAGLGSSLREISGRRLTLIEHLVSGPDLELKASQNGEGIEGVLFQMILTGDHTGVFRNLLEEKLHSSEKFSYVIVDDPDGNRTRFIFEARFPIGADRSEYTEEIDIFPREILELYYRYRDSIFMSASFVLPEVAPPQPGSTGDNDTDKAAPVVLPPAAPTDKHDTEPPPKPSVTKPTPEVIIPLSAADKKLLRDELRPSWMIAAASATPVKIESRPIQIAESEYLKFAPGEILTASPDTLKWLKNNCKVTDDGVEYLDLVPMRRLYWYEFKSTTGNITLRIPVRFDPSRKRNPFVVDGSITPEAYISFAKNKTTIKLSDDRFVVKNAKDGSIEFFMLDGSFDDERIKDFHFRTTSSKDSTIIMGAANILNSDGTRLDEAGLRAETRDALDVTTVAVLGHDVVDMPKVRYVNPKVTFKNKKDVTLTFVSPLENNRVEPIQAHLDGLSFDGDNLTSDSGNLVLSFDAPEAHGAPELEKIAVSLTPTATENVFALTEDGDGQRLFLWNKSLGLIWEPNGIDLTTLPGNATAILKDMNFPPSPTGTTRITHGTRKRHADNGSLVHIDERIAYLPAALSSVPVNYVITENPSDDLIDDAIVNAHNKRFIPDEETFHVMLAGGRPREMATFVSPDDGSMLILPLETDPSNKSWYRLVKEHKDAATFGAQLLLPHPNKAGEFILVPAKVYGDGAQIHVVTKTNAVLSLNMASTRANVNRRRLSGFLASIPKINTEYSVSDVRAALYEETEFYGLDEAKTSPNLSNNERFVLGSEIILKDGRELMLTVNNDADNGRLSFAGFIIDDANNREYIEYLNPDGSEGEMTVYRAQNGGALYYLDDGKEIYTLEIDDNGQPLILKRPQGIERFFTPKQAPRHIMINGYGQAYQSKAKSPATRREISEPGTWPRIFEITTDLGRSQGSGGNSLAGDFDTRDARVKIEIGVAEDGSWGIRKARIKTQGKDKPWQEAECGIFRYGPGNQLLRLYIKGSERREKSEREYFDFAWLDFADDTSLLGENFGLRASHFNMKNTRQNVLPTDAHFGETTHHDAMLWSAIIFSDGGDGVSLMDRVIKTATDVGYFAGGQTTPADLVEYFMNDNPNDILPAVAQAVRWLNRPAPTMESP